jgi:hypothetical protein
MVKLHPCDEGRINKEFCLDRNFAWIELTEILKKEKLKTQSFSR